MREGDVSIVDFEGEPLRSLHERRAKHIPLRDVAGMLRSFDYAVAVAEREAGTGVVAPGGGAALTRWVADATRLYLESYLGELPSRPEAGDHADLESSDAMRMVRLFCVEKALYEVQYELANRPGWVSIPLRGVLALLGPPGTPENPGGPPVLNELAGRCGIEPDYRDVRGELKKTSDATSRALLRAMGVTADDEAAASATLTALDQSDWEQPLPPVFVLQRTAPPFTVDMTLPAGTREVAWRVTLEDATVREGTLDFAALGLQECRESSGVIRERRSWGLPEGLPDGYHELALLPGIARTALIISPGRCWLPPAIRAGSRLWGVSTQLYLLRSAANWGIGDYGDLGQLIETLLPLGVNIVGLNPLHAMFLDAPEQASPYSPASRLALNVLNIDVMQAVALTPGVEVDALLPPPLLARRAACRQAAMVDYSAVAALKLEVLSELFKFWQARPELPGWPAFIQFRQQEGERLQRSVLFLALRDHFSGSASEQADWHRWPREFHDPTSPAVGRFAIEHADLVTFHAWLQYLADAQLAGVAAKAKPMAIGLYRDLAVGADRSGAETWSNQTAVVADAQVGAPPDLHNPAGQNWGLPPFNPRALRAEAYRSFVDLIRVNMRHAGGLRIDHVMALQHLYWVPNGRSPAEGAYVRYPLADLVGILALESERQRCLVVGEDLGTVPEGFRERMTAANILSYRVLFFEQDDAGFIEPSRYPALAVAVEGSHDLPTLRAWWQGADLDLKERLNLFPHADDGRRLRQQREQDRRTLRAALVDAGVTDGDGDVEGEGDGLFRAAHAFLAQTASAVALVQLDDITDELSPVNVPTTSDEHPNWRRKLSMTLGEIATSSRLALVAALFGRERTAPKE